LAKILILIFLIHLTGCTSNVKNEKHYVLLDCFKNNKFESRKIKSNVALTNEQIQLLIPTVENKFGYQPGSCKQN